MRGELHSGEGGVCGGFGFLKRETLLNEVTL